jgi:PAS domain S-box-containing protein
MTSADTDNLLTLADLDGALSGFRTRWADLDHRGRQQAALLAFGRRATARPALAVLVQDAVALAAEVLSADYGGAAEFLPDGRMALRIAAVGEAGLAEETTVHKLPIEASRSMAGYALNQALPVVSVNLATEARFTDLLLRRLGVVAALTVPLRCGKESFGALGVYSRQERPFTSHDVGFAETIAHLLTSSMARTRAEEAMREQAAMTGAILDATEALVVRLDAEGKFLDFNRACAEAAGFAPDEVRGRPFHGVFAVPEEADAIQHALRRAGRGKTAGALRAQLLAKDGRRRQIAWELRPLSDDLGFVRTILLVGSDRTELPGPRRPSPVEAGPSRSIAIAPPPDGPEKRSSPRREYQYRQAIAPMDGKRLPARRDFFEVECEDISAGGISFYLDRPPEFEYLVVALGKAPTLTWFAALVVRVVDRSAPDAPRFLVGCRFTGRVHL